ncbi:MAG: hypothetical protein QG556_367 [Pseudomonadota bacterium]|nr:hypothetical protein [Pseudomonadota bacterium]
MNDNEWILNKLKEAERQLKAANETIAALQKCKEVTDEGYRKLLGERGELQDKLKISEDAFISLKEITYSESENGRDSIVLIEETLKQIRGENDNSK